jgi:dolichol-phosphate mannosyltransferase
VARGSDSFFDQDGFQVMVDILLKLRKESDLVFGEVPLILRYDVKEGESKMQLGATVRKTLRVIGNQLLKN